MSFGIEAAGYYVPGLYLEIKDLAEKRGIEPAKLEKGLGLHKMGLSDVHEDAATFAAEALLKLIQDYDINPKEIARVYLGTESALDAAKPTASYAVQMVEKVLEEKFGTRCFRNCDVLDMTFACVGGVDALHNALDFVRVNPDKKAVVIASDYAKYELASSGEYTQGGGAVALLVSSKPDLLEIENNWGVASESVFDFFKPRRMYKKEDLKGAPETYPEKIEIFTDEPVFDGQYSNQCYQDRIREAYHHYKEITGQEKPYENWKYIIFHLPYAFHGKRVFTEIYSLENELPYGTPEEQKAVAKSEGYLQLINDKIEKTQRASSEIGNMYTASVFMAFLSALQTSFNENEDLSGKEIGFVGYGSGSKSKIFAGRVSENWRKIAEKWNLFESLKQRTAVDFDTYEKLHRKLLNESVNKNYKGFGLVSVETENPVLTGARYYSYQK
ncbi:hydroxymethylglutaryl-CoA synthase family protein [Chryseobacterium indologenes]|uniref:Hydroxymethylglutaryl-CoA synthase family protein n=1 Tax=Chryseobacterium indologenes TaxID=253 RepID=A0AAD1DVL1_CHRID|nr:hydroxymethylglutaryl-CoA synthase [Chryseobacterium indologenes]AYZ34792.1 hydroxymethylglutaryl-CoA synthase family protein [Chryseobacterium indologenes]AZB17998.1 hydroxymethylglutaryl-CoA synthase family protein [Chryseobacterium indologenes]MBF6643380.1 hydroxymethylglutaryl-CoA synthase family protein [Chryseobacterium indologenes]MBU3050569.1 hydroxymethylglutaryl-CoA synthase [Chryseobacterium indologenes]QPQ52287.1 hydroxymethylglutaryl-CoA synthase family protein [Chryseobacteriu